jgi:hypothetical protein
VFGQDSMPNNAQLVAVTVGLPCWSPSSTSPAQQRWSEGYGDSPLTGTANVDGTTVQAEGVFIHPRTD